MAARAIGSLNELEADIRRELTEGTAGNLPRCRTCGKPVGNEDAFETPQGDVLHAHCVHPSRTQVT